jgi:hypothetical protein
MPYRDPERRRLAERRWRQTHREERAAYMRRYRRARSSGRRPGRPRSLPITAELADVEGRSSGVTTRTGLRAPESASEPLAERENGAGDALAPSTAALGLGDFGPLGTDAFGTEYP